MQLNYYTINKRKILREKLTNFLLDLFFPRFCFGCQKERSYLCQDCRATLEISRFHQQYPTQNLSDLYFALNYQGPLIKNLIQKFKYQPFIKELAFNLTSLIIEHFQLLDYPSKKGTCTLFADYILIPVPLEKRRLKWRGFNQAEEIAKELSSFWGIPLISDCLIKTKETIPQVELETLTREENVKNAFSIRNEELVKNKKILLVDDVYTTGSTLEEAAKILKKVGAKEIIGIVIVRAAPNDDRLDT